jgi:DDE superfamily endonuclease
MDWLVSTHYAATTKIQVVQDNLNTHTYGAFYEPLSAERAHELKNTLEFHFTPKHASWLNMAELELSVLVRQCLDRRIASPEELQREAVAWQNKRNDAAVKIGWTFTTQKARLKFQRHYKKLNPNN